jgi:hypothetical protein
MTAIERPHEADTVLLFGRYPKTPSPALSGAFFIGPLSTAQLVCRSARSGISSAAAQRPPSASAPSSPFDAPPLGGVRSAHTCSACHDAASEGADSSKTRFHRQMISIAAATTIPGLRHVSKSLPMMPALCVPSVSMPPGAIALTRIFRGPSSAASPRVIASTAPLVPE